MSTHFPDEENNREGVIHQNQCTYPYLLLPLHIVLTQCGVMLKRVGSGHRLRLWLPLTSGGDNNAH